MKTPKKVLVVFTMVLMVALFGCRSEPETPPEEPVSPGTAPAPEPAPGSTVPEQQPQTGAGTTDTEQSKEAYAASLENQLNTLDNQIDRLGDRIAALPAETKTEVDEMMRSLQAQKEVVQARLEELKAASADEWQDLKASTEEAVTDLQQVYNNLVARLPRQG